MKRLTLLRHAKSSWADPDLPDHERPLNPRGKRDAPRMGSRLAQRGERPSLILTSTAIRARATARLVANELNYPWEFLQSDPALYHAAPSEIRSVIAAQDDSFAHILVVGHNPGFTELAQELIPGWDVANVPTSGVVAIQLAIEHWADVGNAEGQLRYFDFPKNKAPAEAPPD